MTYRSITINITITVTININININFNINIAMRKTPKSLTKRGGGGMTETASSSVSISYNDHNKNDHGPGPMSISQQSQSPSRNDVESGKADSGGGGGGNNPKRFISPKEKADFNARLEERRKQRHGQRRRRKQRQDQHRSALGRTFGNTFMGGRGRKRSGFCFCFRSSTSFVLACAFFTILCGWIFTFLYLAQDMEFSNGVGGVGSGVKSPLQLTKPAGFFRHIKDNIKDNIKEAIHEIPKPFGKKSKKKDMFAAVSGISKSSAVVDNVRPLKADDHEIIDMRIMNAELPFANDNGGAWTQGWDVQPIELTNTKPLKIFVVPHSHCDPGWIKTFDEYFQSQTKQILSSIIASLLKNPKRKFIWAEISYFEWWWKEQSATTKQNVISLMQNKQFEFVTGGWVQPDEANTQLYAMEIQLEEGHDFIRNAFGQQYIPKYGWSIDPFGYSPTMAYLLKKHGFKAMLIQRVHYAIKKELALHKNLEFMWRQTWDDSPNGDYDIFAHVMPFYSYDVPHTCGPDPSVCCQFDFARVPYTVDYVSRCPWKNGRKTIDAKLINDQNIKERSLLLLDQYRKKANLYRTNVVIAPLGDDFRYRTVEEADLQFDNYQKIFDYINANVDNVEISFGTLSEYFETIMNERRFSPPVLKGAFFTYSDREEDYWSGYFTSRIFDKALDRKLERVLYAATSLGGTKEELQSPRRALSLFQHHDGVTGTAKDSVVLDYAKRIHGAIRETQNWILRHLVSNSDHGMSQSLAMQLKLMACWQSSAPRGLSQNLCDQGAGTKVIVYNPLETEQSCGSVVVPGRTIAHAKLPCEIPGPLSAGNNDHNQKPAGIQFDPHTGLMIHPVLEEWMVWKVKKGGAYLFFPDTMAEYNTFELDVQEGGAVVVTKYWKRTVVERQLPADDNGEDGGIAIDFIYETNLQTNNEEWFARFTHPKIENHGIFHTDLNGFNFDTHHFRDDMPIQSQVFPMPTLASVEDSLNRMTVLSEHAQGAASLEEGGIDVWLDRRLGQDDERGLSQGVTDNVPTRTRLRLVLEEKPTENTKAGEFSITPFCKRQWKELNHPLEMFGSAVHSGSQPLSFGVGASIDAIQLDNSSIEAKRKLQSDPHVADMDNAAGMYNIAAVYMVYDRVDYLKQAIDTLRESDYPTTLPLVISHDGHNAEVVQYVESLKSEFKIIQLFHPFSCTEHPDTFPGEDPKLNENFAGDTFGNKRESKITCCKHHFSWMINTVFDMEVTQMMDGFLFLEEDYIVAPTIYQTIQKGFTYIDTKHRREEFFGLTFDPTDGYAYKIEPSADWIERKFVTGPMALRRDIFAKIKSHARDFCEWDDYNWDWSIVHLMAMKYLPFKILVPGTLQSAHIGLEGGMHNLATTDTNRVDFMNKIVKDGKLQEFHADVAVPHVQHIKPPKMKKQGFGGWGHPADQQHCMEVFGAAK